MKKKLSILTAIAAATAMTAMTASSVLASEMEKCRILDTEGRGLIKEHKGDCTTASQTSAGQSVQWDPEAWIMVPEGECAKINSGDVSGISEDIKAKIEVDFLPKAAAVDASMEAMPEDASMEAMPEDAEHSH